MGSYTMSDCHRELNEYFQKHVVGHIDLSVEITKYLKPCIKDGLTHKDYLSVIALISSNLQLINSICQSTLTGDKQAEKCAIGVNPAFDNMENFMMISDVFSATRLLKNHLKNFLIKSI